MKPIALLVYVCDVKAGLAWYQKAFPEAKAVYLEEFDFTIVNLHGFSLEIVQADNNVGSGKEGTVLYWSVPLLEVALNHFIELGASLYRGPMLIENAVGMCQVQDPFGNLIGLRGKFSDSDFKIPN
ncbi:MAG: glyoxalase/bleomycin resistance/dioxygenase family protein [Oceanospirillaceae bacterium]|nr:glyoxalase/bleomycin resistance/dioxygenase family protein [Oceanospirillaceae bacterium]